MDNIQPGQTSSSLLVIEDNASQLKSLLDILETEGLQPIGCQTGRGALAACQEHNIHVAILDLRLPDMDGLDVLSQLKQQIPDMKVIINTAYATLESAMDAVNKEAYAYVQKMGDPEELLAHVHRAFHAHLAGYSEQLEQEVRKQTAELVAANDAFRQESAEHMQTEKALRESEENFRALAENANDEILIATGEGVHIYANKRAAEITGYSVAKLLTETIKDVLHPDAFKTVMERYTKWLKGEHQYETIFVRKDGQNIPIEISEAKTIWQGQPASLIIIRDITERKQAEEVLQAVHDELEQRVEKNLFKPVINEAIHAGIPVICFDSDVPESKRLAIVTTDNYHAGYLAGKTIAEWLNDAGNIGVVTLKNVIHLEERVRGFKDGVASISPETTIFVIEKEGGFGFSHPDMVYDHKILLKAHPDIRGLFAVWALTGTATAEAVRDLKLTGKIQILSFDFDPVTIDAIERGEIRATVAQNPYLMGYCSMLLVYSAAHPTGIPSKHEGFGHVPASIDTGAAIIGKGEVEAYKNIPKVEVLQDPPLEYGF